jgi:predicted transcriptional regulator
MAMSENSVKVFKYLQANNEGFTAKEIAGAIDLTDKQVNGVFTALVKKGYGYRSEDKVKVTLEDGTEIEGKQLFLNDEGLAADVDALAAE